MAARGLRSRLSLSIKTADCQVTVASTGSGFYHSRIVKGRKRRAPIFNVVSLDWLRLAMPDPGEIESQYYGYGSELCVCISIRIHIHRLVPPRSISRVLDNYQSRKGRSTPASVPFSLTTVTRYLYAHRSYGSIIRVHSASLRKNLSCDKANPPPHISTRRNLPGSARPKGTSQKEQLYIV